MEWMLRLVGTGLEGQSGSFDVMEISRPDDLGDIADLGMTLSEAKQWTYTRIRSLLRLPPRGTSARPRPVAHSQHHRGVGDAG